MSSSPPHPKASFKKELRISSQPYIAMILQLRSPPTWFPSESFPVALKIVGLIFPSFSYTLAPTAKHESTKLRQFALNSPLPYIASVKQSVALDGFMTNHAHAARSVSSHSEGGKGRNAIRKDPITEDDDDSAQSSQERSEFSKLWRAIKFSHDEVESLLKQVPVCERCSRMDIPCKVVEESLTCEECKVRKVVCPRKFSNTVRALAHELRENEEEVRSRYTCLMVPSAQRGKKGGSDSTKLKGKKGEANRDDGKGKHKEKVKVLRTIIPGRGNKANETETSSERSHSRALCSDEEAANEGGLKTVVHAPGMSKTPSERSPQLSHMAHDAHTGDKALDIGSKSLEMHVDSPVPPNVDDKSQEMAVDPPTPNPSSLFHPKAPGPPLAPKHKVWDYISRSDLYKQLEAANARVQQSANQHLKVESEVSELRKKMEKLEQDRDEALREAEGSTEKVQLQVQGLETEPELLKLRKELEALAKERDEASQEANRLVNLRGLRDTTTAFLTNIRPHPLGNCQASMTTKRRQSEDLGFLRSELGELSFFCLDLAFLIPSEGKGNSFPSLLSEFAAFTQEVRTTSYALEDVEASVSRDTDFRCEKFRTTISNLSKASSLAAARISTMERGKCKVVSEESGYNWGGLSQK
ncbi:hypothetical protein M413DRAFT_32279 [Hebeloma cylindrosporum]|uniref:Uncharacterized protein n=1 Tax=Hebeloma cylindrosporum TaxID=76867 RepID=A0A0C3BUH8_HEBCY|nr:hypothetical protein M413DRAFT_32279 [Hebeloma cylindrosporum h7]